jgi:hypothetical protein
MARILLLLNFVYCSIGWSQKNVFITFSPKVNGTDFQTGINYQNLNGTSFNLDHFDYYISGVQLVHDGGQILNLSSDVFLVEPTNHTIYLGYLNVDQIDSVRFSVGVPANLNTSSGIDAVDISTYPAGSPLSFQDPSMYWGWTAGYMHMIIGGLADSNNDGISDYLFELHNLGDNNYRQVQLPIVQTNTNNNQIDVYLNCNIEQWIKDIPIETVGILHGTSGINMEIMKNIETEPVFTQPNTASSIALNALKGRVFHVFNAENNLIHWESILNAHLYQITNAEGKTFGSDLVSGIDGSIELNDLAPGLYVFSIYDQFGNQLNKLNFIQ